MSVYTDLITSEHAGATNFVAVVAASTDPFVDLQATLAGMAAAFDLDSAAGAQLDVVGVWVGRTRQISTPINGVYFAWGTPGVGWGQGYWKGPYDPTQGVTSLSDAPYRTLLRATIALNHWDGTVPGAAAVFPQLFPNNAVAIEDHQNMTMSVVVSGPAVDAVTASLLTGGYLTLKPGCIAINYVFTSNPPAPVFGWGVANDYFAGWGSGAWGVATPPTA